MLKRGNLASFSDIRHHPFPFVYEIVRKTHDNSSQVIVGVYICIIIEAVHDGKAIDDIQSEFSESLSVVPSNPVSHSQLVHHSSGYYTRLAKLLLQTL